MSFNTNCIHVSINLTLMVTWSQSDQWNNNKYSSGIRHDSNSSRKNESLINIMVIKYKLDLYAVDSKIRF